MYKNIANQRVTLLAINTLTNQPHSGDAANILGFIKKDNGALAPLDTPVPLEIDPVNAKGLYDFLTTQVESNADKIVISGVSTTPNVVLVPFVVFTLPVALTTLVGGGSGARTIFVTVNDGASPVESALVRFTKGVDSFALLTNVAGQATFNLDDGTWVVAITRPGYSFPGTTLVIIADATPVYSMTTVALLPSVIPNSTTGQSTIYGKDGLPAANVEVTYSPAELPLADSGVIYDTQPNVSISDVNGLAQFPNLVKGMSYGFTPARAAQPAIFVIPTTAGAAYQLPSMLN